MAQMKARATDTLSQADIEALLASMPGEQEGRATPPPPSSDKQIRTWNFRKPDKFSKDHMRSLLALHQNFARLAATALSARLRSNVMIKVTSVDQGLYEEYIDLLPDQSVVNVVSMRPLEGNLLMEFQPELAMVMLDRLLGGTGSVGEANHELTDIELALVRNLDRTILEALQEAWVNLAEVDPTLEEISMTPQLVQIASPADIAVIVLLEVQIGDRLGTISMCIPHLVIEPLMQRLSAQVWVVSNRRKAPTTEMRDNILSGLRGSPVTVTAVLSETTVTVGEVLRLQEGDVLLLGSGSVGNVRLKVGDQYKFSGLPGLVGGRMAVKIGSVDESEGGND